MTKQQGFSLMELVMVMVVIGILAAVAMPRMGNLSSYSLNSAASDLLEALRFAQQQSMSHSGAAHFEVVLSGSGFTVQRKGGGSVANPLTGAAGYTQDAEAWSGVSITSATGTITFDSRGQPLCNPPLTACSQPGDSNFGITLLANGENQTVTIERYTGYAHL